MRTKVPRIQKSSPERPAFPTVLVAVQDKALRRELVAGLLQGQCFVLEADTEDKAVHLFITHSRPIRVAVLG